MCRERRGEDHAEAFAQDRQQLLDEEIGRTHVHGEQRVEVLDRGLLNGRCLGDTRIGDEDVEPLLPWSITSRPLVGEPPTIDLAVGYRKDNPSTVLRSFLANIDQLIAAGPAGQRAASA